MTNSKPRLVKHPINGTWFCGTPEDVKAERRSWWVYTTGVANTPEEAYEDWCMLNRIRAEVPVSQEVSVWGKIFYWVTRK